MDRHATIPVVVFFVGILVAGLVSFKDYGISWDEPFQRKYGLHLYDYVTRDDLRVLEGPMKYYGPAFEICLLFAQKALRLEDTRSIYLVRHLLTFLVFFVGAVFFYKLCRRMFGSWKTGLLGALFLVLSPRFFAEAFYNPKDMPFLALCVISIYTLVRYLDTRALRWSVVHGVVCALLVDIRIVGFLVPALTAGFVAVDAVLAWRQGARVGRHFLKLCLLKLCLFGAVLLALVVLAWPTLWHRPFYQLVQAFKEMSHYPLGVKVMYCGQYMQAQDLPWHYTPVWIAISTPIIYLAGFVLGLLVLVMRAAARLRSRAEFCVWPGNHGAGSVARGAGAGNRIAGVGNLGGQGLKGSTAWCLAGASISGRNAVILLLWFFFPMLYVTISGATLFDGWRHTYFTYPALLGIALVGMSGLLTMLRSGLGSVASRVAVGILVGAITVGLLNIARIMLKYHPYEHLYFNALTGGLRGAEGRFDLDYWGLSYRQALEAILKIDKDPTVKVCAYARPGKVNAEILPAEDRKRLVFEPNPYDAKYYMTDLRWDKFQYPREDIVHEIFVDGARIMVVVRVVPRGP